MKNQQILMLCYSAATLLDSLVVLGSLGYYSLASSRWVLCIDDEDNTKRSIVWQSLKIITKQRIVKAIYN